MGRLKARRPKKRAETATKDDVFDVVSLQDPRIDFAKMEAEDGYAYQRTLDPQHIAILSEDDPPASFRISPLNDDQMDECDMRGAAAVDRYGGTSGGITDARAQALAAFELCNPEIEGDFPDSLKDRKGNLSREVRKEIGGYILALTKGNFDTAWREDLGKSSWLGLWAQRRSIASEKPPSEDSTATPATETDEQLEDAANSPSDFESESESTTA